MEVAAPAGFPPEATSHNTQIHIVKAQYVPIKATILVAGFLFALSGVVRARFTFTTNNSTITITGCTGNPTTLNIPATTNGYPVTLIGGAAFASFPRLTTVTFPGSITNLGNGTFVNCTSLTGVCFQGNAPGLGGADVFFNSLKAIVYYLPGTAGWGPRLSGQPTVLWNPLAQTGAGSFGVQTNQFGFSILGSSNLVVVVEASTNLAGAIWSPVATNTLNTFIGTNGSSYFSDAEWTNYAGRFYRLRSPYWPSCIITIDESAGRVFLQLQPVAVKWSGWGEP
jgi:BspA type Leucine rich repeat region (6 copies)